MRQFSVDSATGYISVVKPLDREVLSSYVLEVEAVDGGIPSLSSVALVNVEISDVNDNAPIFSEQNYTAVVQVCYIPIVFLLSVFLYCHFISTIFIPIHNFFIFFYFSGGQASWICCYSFEGY